MIVVSSNNSAKTPDAQNLLIKYKSLRFLLTVFSFIILITSSKAKPLLINNALETYLLLSQKLTDLSNSSEKQELSDLLEWADEICSEEIRDSSDNNFNYVINAIDESTNIEKNQNSIINSNSNSKFVIIINELRFRILVAIQLNLENAYQKLPVKEKFANTIAFASANTSISETKTKLINQQIGTYPSLRSPDEKQRSWLAIMRMLGEIDIEKSETEDQVIQRSPYGIIITKNEIYDKLSLLIQNENNEDVKEYAEETFDRIKNCDTKYKEFKSEIVLDNLTDLSASKTINEEALTFFNKAVEGLGNHEKIDLYTKAIEKDSSFTAAYNNRGICLFQNNDFQSAINDFNKVIETDSSNLEVYVYIGNGYLRMGNYDSAIVNYTKALKSNFPSKSIYNNRGLCYHKLEKYDNAIDDYTKAIEQDSVAVSTITNRAQCYLALNKYNNAIADYNLLISLDSENSKNYYNLGCIYWKKQNWKKVVDVWEKGLALNPDDDLILKNIAAAKQQLKK